MRTIRQQMTQLMSQEARGARELSRLLAVSEKEVYAHLPHVRRTVAAAGGRLKVTPAQCLSCGYVFTKRSRFNRPGRCVRCKSERITEPVYQVFVPEGGNTP